MEIVPIRSALRRKEIGAFLIALQIALTLAIVCNCLAVIGEHLRHMRRPTGLDEANLFTLANVWPGHPEDLKTRIEDDVRALRSLPGVVDAGASNSFPLRGGGMGDGIALKSGQQQASAQSAIYMVDEHGLATWGLRLVAGRWFGQDEIGQLAIGDKATPPAIVITQALANALFPGGQALGKSVYLSYLSPAAPTRIVGIIQRAQSPWGAVSWGEPFIENSTFIPYRFLNNGLFYLVRTQPGQQASVMREAQNRLYEINGSRTLDLLRPFAAARRQAYRFEADINVILVITCILMLAVTAFGVVGLTTYWVAQRRRQIGIRRALGARRLDILRHVHAENLLIGAIGAALGILLAVGANTWLATSLQLTRISVGFILGGAVIVLGLGQLAVLWPALRAASVPPALAARGT